VIFSKKRKYQQLTDHELITLWKEEACDYTIPILYERYGHLVLGSCLKYLKQLENAEDITLQLFATLGEKLKKHSITHFKSWLYQVTRNECLMFLRKNKPNQQQEINELTLVDSTNIEDEQLKEVKLDQLEKGIDQLKPEQKQCIELFYLQDKSYQEVSEELNLPINTVKSAIQNGKRNLKIWMEEHENN
jgi:RNA polymerase sigma factor (sigma-70 family)